MTPQDGRKHKKNNYVDRELLQQEFEASRDAGWEWTERFAALLLTLHHQIMRKPSFHHYPRPWKEEMISRSVHRILTSVPKNYKADRGYMFPYLYRAIHLNYLDYIRSEYKRQNRYNQHVYDTLVACPPDSLTHD